MIFKKGTPFPDQVTGFDLTKSDKVVVQGIQKRLALFVTICRLNIKTIK